MKRTRHSLLAAFMAYRCRMTQSLLVTEQVQSKIKKVFKTAGFAPASRPYRLSFNG
nr:MAG TPA: hypothetical protein [Caudoviricetes sp.]